MSNKIISKTIRQKKAKYLVWLGASPCMCGVCMKCPGANHPGWCWAGLGWDTGPGVVTLTPWLIIVQDLVTSTTMEPCCHLAASHMLKLIFREQVLFIKLFMRILHIQYLDTILHYYQHKDCNNVVITTSLQTNGPELHIVRQFCHSTECVLCVIDRFHSKQLYLWIE